ncbi:MAG: TetR/AcrR family transcriptional regulator [Terriglobia bacterium]
MAQLRDSVTLGKAGNGHRPVREILRGVYPERQGEILRFAQDDKRRTQNDRRVAKTHRNSRHFDRKLEMILREAAAVFCAKGFDRASIRDIARATGVSLAGLYYYFSSKEELLYLIQRHTFETVLASSRALLKEIQEPERRLRAFIWHHLQFFLLHPNEMKVLTHEVGPLDAKLGRELKALKKAYYELCFAQVEALRQARKLKGVKTRLAVLSLFGMMNWIYQWYNPRVDPDARECAEQMAEIFLHGIFGTWARRSAEASRRWTKGSANGSRLFTSSDEWQVADGRR